MKLNEIKKKERCSLISTPCLVVIISTQSNHRHFNLVACKINYKKKEKIKIRSVKVQGCAEGGSAEGNASESRQYINIVSIDIN